MIVNKLVILFVKVLLHVYTKIVKTTSINIKDPEQLNSSTQTGAANKFELYY